jgi:predicted kinase
LFNMQKVMTNQTITDITDAYYDALPNKEVRQPKRIVLFSGVAGSGKSTIARAIEKELHAVRLSNDEVRDCIVAACPTVAPKEREQAKFDVGTNILERLAERTSGLLVIDASCDRGYDHYKMWATKHGYSVVLLRMDIPRTAIEQRLHDRGIQGYRDTARSLAMLDTWWQQWEAFGSEHTPDLVVTPETPIEKVLKVVTNSSTV